MQRVLVIGVLVIGILAQHAAICSRSCSSAIATWPTSLTAYARIEVLHADMPTFSTTRRVPFTSRQMFDLVADVEQYPKFLPLCEALVVRKRERAGEVETLVAEMTVGYYALRESFTSRVVLDASSLQVHAASVPEYPSGPFRQVENRWSFAPAEGGCDVQFHIAYEFKSHALQMLVGSIFDRVFRRYTQAFEDRARAVYGAPDAGTASGA